MSGRGRGSGIAFPTIRGHDQHFLGSSAGQHPHRPAATARIDEIDPDQQLNLTVAARGRDMEDLDATVRALDETPASERQYLTREEPAQRHGAHPNDLERVAVRLSRPGVCRSSSECAPAVRSGPRHGSGRFGSYAALQAIRSLARVALALPGIGRQPTLR